MLDTDLTVAYILGRIDSRIAEGSDGRDAVLDTLAMLDEDLYVKALKEGVYAGWSRADLETYLRNYYK